MRNARKAAGKSRRGFTLIEMLAVAIIVGILALIAIPAILNARAQAQESACDANRKLIITAIANYRVRTGTTINGSTNWGSLANTLSNTGYLSPTPKDPATNTDYTVTFQDVNDGAAGLIAQTKVEVTCPNSGTDTNHGTSAGLL
jgi:prepilin-type N-terminal cleavage/methylation domain-containing protein